MTHTYSIDGMHCESCVEKVTASLERVAGVMGARVTLSPPQASVEMHRHVPVSELNDALGRVGSYQLTDPSPNGTIGSSAVPAATDEGSLYPLILILAYLVGFVALVAWTTRDFSLHSVMTRFMGGFFLVFSFFKLLDLAGFAGAYRSYDIVAKSFPAWGYTYPFVELALGVGYVLNWNPLALNTITLLVMAIGSVGVFRALLRRSAIQCACLGTALKLPMTKVALLEDLGMAGMAAAMLTFAR